MERWLSIPGFEGLYEVSSWGRVRSLERTITRGDGRKQRVPERILKPILLRGYPAVALCRDRKAHYRRVHLLVLEAFVAPRPDGFVACHEDGDRGNNRLDNLRWDSQSANMLDAVRHGTHPQAGKSRCPNGHEYTPENTYITPCNGGRSCRTCRRDHQRARRQRRKAVTSRTG